jgi:hypothetical protein
MHGHMKLKLHICFTNCLICIVAEEDVFQYNVPQVKKFRPVVKILAFFFPLPAYSWYVQKVIVAPDHSQWHKHSHSVGLLWTSGRPVAETSTWQHTTLTRREIHAFRRNRTSNPSKLAVACPHLRPRGHWNRSLKIHSLKMKRKHLHFASLNFFPLFRFAHLQMACSILAYLFTVFVHHL